MFIISSEGGDIEAFCFFHLCIMVRSFITDSIESSKEIFMTNSIESSKKESKLVKILINSASSDNL